MDDDDDTERLEQQSTASLVSDPLKSASSLTVSPYGEEASTLEMDMGLDAELDTLLPSSSDSKLSDGEATFNSTRSMAFFFVCCGWKPKRRRMYPFNEAKKKTKQKTNAASLKSSNTDR